MTTEPGASRQPTTSSRAVTSPPPRASGQAPPPAALRPNPRPPAPEPSVVPLIGAVVTLLLGVLLGISAQAARGTDMGLRVPALLAALLMVGQGVVDIKRHLPDRKAAVVAEPTMPADDGTAVMRATELALVREQQPRPQPRPVTATLVKPTPVNLAVPITVMLLAAWLGLADLSTPTAPTSLTVLSLIASFALFALGWSLLPARR